MTDLLKAICCGDYEPRIGFHPMSEEGEALWNRAADILGREAVDQLVLAQAGPLQEESCDWFREGFRLGALLMLELLYTPSKRSV